MKENHANLTYIDAFSIPYFVAPLTAALTAWLMKSNRKNRIYKPSSSQTEDTDVTDTSDMAECILAQ